MTRLLPTLATLLLLGTAPPGLPVGKFATWLPSKRVPLDIESGGVTVHVEARACPEESHSDDTCSWEGYSSLATVTASAPGIRPIRVSSSAYVRVAVARFAAQDPRPGVIVESQSGGSSGEMTAQLLVPVAGGFRALPVEVAGVNLQNELADFPHDLSGDGRIDMVLRDGRFAYALGCGACTPRPPLPFAVKNGRVVDESRDPALRPVFVADMKRLHEGCLSKARYRNGACAAYVADAARAGRFDAAWTAMLRHYEHGADIWQRCDAPPSDYVDHRCPEDKASHYRDFPESLRAFLIRTGYLPA